jgi:hypothetical protein
MSAPRRPILRLPPGIAPRERRRAIALPSAAEREAQQKAARSSLRSLQERERITAAMCEAMGRLLDNGSKP